MNGPSNVLLIDDDPEATEILRHLLARVGFHGALRTQHEPAVALQFVAEATEAGTVPQLILVDLGLPQMHGLDVVREIRRLLGSHALDVRAFAATAASCQNSELRH